MRSMLCGPAISGTTDTTLAENKNDVQGGFVVVYRYRLREEADEEQGGSVTPQRLQLVQLMGVMLNKGRPARALAPSPARIPLSMLDLVSDVGGPKSFSRRRCSSQRLTLQRAPSPYACSHLYMTSWAQLGSKEPAGERSTFLRRRRTTAARRFELLRCGAQLRRSGSLRVRALRPPKPTLVGWPIVIHVHDCGRHLRLHAPRFPSPPARRL
ncbi:hypothetical protein PENSPDRAFT_342230 [Peniophora sp. CONT]|nr:hypothetical protein PENSPDRAFT_342230 [Peniophora sp. CONT]